jgi:hypothetical protein
MQPEFSFRLNGVNVPMLFISRERSNGRLTGRRHVAVYVEGIGRFTIDDDANLWNEAFQGSVLEYRNDTEWENVNPLKRQMRKDGGWQQVTPDELIAVLKCAGVFDCD